MNDFQTAMKRGFADAKRVLGASVLMVGDKRYEGVSSTVLDTRELEDSGYLGMADKQFDIDADDYAASAISDRSRVTVDGTAFKVIGIQRAIHSPCVHLLLKLDR